MFFVKRECACCAETYHAQKEVFLFCVKPAFFDYSSARTHPFDQSALRFAVRKACRRCHASSFLLQAIHSCLTKGVIVSLSDRSVSAGRYDLV
jgi:hypothetical protein